MDAKRLRTSKIWIRDLPDDILTCIVSLLTIKEAAKTSILSRRWRYLWKTSVATIHNLHLDILPTKNSCYADDEFRDCFSGPSYYCLSMPDNCNATAMHKFVGYVFQILHLDHTSVRDSLRFRFYLENGFDHYDAQFINLATTQTNEFLHNISQWIDMAITKRCQDTRIDLAHLVIKREIYHDGNRYYHFPHLFSTHRIGPSMNNFSFKRCSITPPNSNVYHSLVDLRLKRIIISKKTNDSILSNCPNLESFCLSRCSVVSVLRMKSLKLKQLAIIACFHLKKIEIDAKNLTFFHYRGDLVELIPINVPRLSNMLFKPRNNALSYVCGKLASDFPHLESLIISVQPMEEKKIPRQLPLFCNLKKLRLTVSSHGETLWGFIRLLEASPHLRMLELQLEIYDKEDWESNAIKENELMDRPCDFSHMHLEEIILGGFTGSFSHEVEFTTYLLNTATNLKRLLVSADYSYYLYPAYAVPFPTRMRFEGSDGQVTDTNKGAWEELRNLKRPGVELVFPD